MVYAWIYNDIYEASRSKGVARVRAFPHHYECSAVVHAPPLMLFEHVDDPARLSSHMSQSSWAMGGGRMQVEPDEGRGRTLGSRIRMTGRIFGVRLSVEEAVTERDPPRRKVWETIGHPRLLVIGHYRMGFDIEPRGRGSTLRVFIDYALPDQGPTRCLARLFGSYYARWCTGRMVDDAVGHFLSQARLATA